MEDWTEVVVIEEVPDTLRPKTRPVDKAAEGDVEGEEVESEQVSEELWAGISDIMIVDFVMRGEGGWMDGVKTASRSKRVEDGYMAG